MRPQAETKGPDVAALTARPAALQPWSASLFEAGDNAPQSYDVLMRDAAAALRDSRASAHPQRAAEIIAGQLAEVDAAVTPLPQQALASEVAAALTKADASRLHVGLDRFRRAKEKVLQQWDASSLNEDAAFVRALQSLSLIHI